MEEVWCEKCNKIYAYQLINAKNEKINSCNIIVCPYCGAENLHIATNRTVQIIKYDKQPDDIGEKKND